MRSPTLVSLLLALLCGCAGDAPMVGTASCPPAPDPVAAAAGALVAVPPGDPANGAVLFARECARCHSRDLALRGSRFFRDYPRLDCADYLAAAPPGYLWRSIARGGPAVGRDEAMKPFAELLSEEEIADLVAFLREGV
ncbi:MAG: c-type cytochrome [Myxococcota bacterium]